MPPKSKKVTKKAAPAKKKVTASKTAKTTSKKVVKKAAPKKAAPAKKPVVKKVTKKVAAKKPVAKKVAVKKTVKKATKPAAKKTVAKKPVTKKAAVKKTVVKKTTAKKPVAKKASVKKTSVKKTATKAASVKKTDKAVKKPLAPAAKTAVKPSAKSVSRITPIRAPVPVTSKATLNVNTKAKMSLPNVPPDYEPTDTEEFMSPVMREYFRQRLVAWRDELLRESEETLHILQEEGNMQKPDITDRASEETDLAIEFRTRDRERKLLNKINEAILRVEDGSYGYCEETGDPIPVKRLIARPTATMTLEAQELHERRERTQRDTYE